MRSISGHLGCGIACLLALAGSGSVNAATISQTDSFSIDTTVGVDPISGQALGSAFKDLSFNQFNSSIGTLTGVSVSLTGNAAAVLSFLAYKTAASSTFTNGLSTNTFQLSELGGATSPLVLASSGTLTSSRASGTINGGPAAGQFGYTGFVGSSSAVALSGNVASNDLASFVGTGAGSLFRAGFGTATDTGTFPGFPYFVDGGGVANGDVTVTYSYSPVPLPAAVWLMLSGLGGLGAMTRKRPIQVAAEA